MHCLAWLGYSLHFIQYSPESLCVSFLPLILSYLIPLLCIYPSAFEFFYKTKDRERQWSFLKSHFDWQGNKHDFTQRLWYDLHALGPMVCEVGVSHGTIKLLQSCHIKVTKNLHQMLLKSPGSDWVFRCNTLICAIWTEYCMWVSKGSVQLARSVLGLNWPLRARWSNHWWPLFSLEPSAPYSRCFSSETASL